MQLLAMHPHFIPLFFAIGPLFLTILALFLAVGSLFRALRILVGAQLFPPFPAIDLQLFPPFLAVGLQLILLLFAVHPLFFNEPGQRSFQPGNTGLGGQTLFKICRGRRLRRHNAILLFVAASGTLPRRRDCRPSSA